MSVNHPIIAVTGSSGAGTSTTSLAFQKIFTQLKLSAATIEGDSFHRYTRPEMDVAIRKAKEQSRHISYFGPESNDFGLLEQSLIEYGEKGQENVDIIYTPTMKPFPTIFNLELLRHGNPYLKIPIYYFMKGYMVVL